MPTTLAGYRTTPARDSLDALMVQMEENPLLQETYQAATSALLALQAEDVGWAPLNILNQDDGFTLGNLKQIAVMAELETTSKPLLKRGLGLRTENVFGKGLSLNGTIQPRFKTILDKPVNKRALFDMDSFARNERECYEKGNLFMAYNRKTKVFFAIPFSEITDAACNPDVKDDVWFYQRTYCEVDPITNTYSSTETVEWYPVLEKFEDGVPRTGLKIANKKVNFDYVIVDMKVNTTIGKVWGIPDVLPAMPYAWAHDQYIRDASKLLKALSTIAWKVVAKNKGNAVNASAKVNLPKRPGSTAVMTDNTDMVSMPRSGQVNMRDGQPIAGYVASALGVSLIALLADPGTASGSYGAAATLDGPSANSARSRQASWVNFYERILRLLGIKDVTVTFPKLSEDPIFRQIQTMVMLGAAGGLWQDELRAAGLQATDIIALHDTLPPPEMTAKMQNALGFIQAQNAQEAADQAATAAAAAAPDPQSRQGNSGAAGGLSQGDNQTRDQAHTPGTGSN